MADPAPLLTLIDASGFIFRAYHAIQSLSTSRGVPTNAVYGFTRMLLKTLRELHGYSPKREWAGIPGWGKAKTQPG